MKIAVRYQSLSGNTKTVAEEIARAAGVKAESVKIPLDGPVDILFLGGAVYAGHIGPSLKKFIKKLDAGSVKSVAAFSTAQMTDGTKMIAAALEKNGISLRAETLPLRVSSGNVTRENGKNVFTLSEEHKTALSDFVAQATK